MENILQTLEQNYIWIIVVAIFVVFTVIGYFVDKRQNKERKAKKDIELAFGNNDKKTEEIDEVKEFSQAMEVNTPIAQEVEEETKMDSTFLKEDNYDLGELVNNKAEEEQPVEQSDEQSVEPIAPEVEEQEKSVYDRNLEYLLKEQEGQEDKQEIESIDDFLQRTMREAYQPKVEEEVQVNTIQEVENPATNIDIDYEDTMPIPIQKESEFSPMEVTVVDPEFYKETSEEEQTTEKTEEPKQEIDFKPIEDAILESLEKLSEIEEKK